MIDRFSKNRRRRESRSRPGFHIGVVAVVLTIATLSGCQEDLEVGVVNLCGEPVEVDVNDASGAAPIWVALSPGKADYVAGLSEDPDWIYLQSRLEKSAKVGQFEVPRSRWNSWRTDDEFEVLIPLENEFCP